MGKNSLDQVASHDFEDKSSPLKEGLDVTPVISLSMFSLRSAFHHLKIMTAPRIASHHQNDEADMNINLASISNSSDKIAMDLRGRDSSSYSIDVAVDPFWPICMFELRGKCNNDECPWQHVKDHCIGRMSQDVYGDSDGAGMIHFAYCFCVSFLCLIILIPPLFFGARLSANFNIKWTLL